MNDFRDLRNVVKQWARLWGVPSLATIDISVNERLRTCLGRCFPKSNRVELNANLLRKNRARLTEVLCHEAAHLAAYRLGNQSSPHSLKWASLMTAAGFKPSRTISLRRCVPEKLLVATPKGLFKHYCQTCGFTRFARRSVSRWKCRMCVMAGLSGILTIKAPPAQSLEIK
jgi:predicted SprT family Zn-dependent metalloprotease